MATCVRSQSEDLLPPVYHVHRCADPVNLSALSHDATTHSKKPHNGDDNSNSTVVNPHWYEDFNNELSIALTTATKHRIHRHHQTTATSFLDLPPELRLQIYHLIFHNAKIRLGYGDLIDGNKSTPIRGLNFPNAILQTCKAIRAEAMPILQQNIALQVNWTPSNYKGERLVLDLPRVWREKIRYAHFAGLREALVRLDCLVGLKEVVLGYHLYEKGGDEVEGQGKEDVDDEEEEVRRRRICELPEVRIAKRAFLTEAVEGLKVGNEVSVKMLLHVHGLRPPRVGTRRFLIDIRG